MTDTWIKQSEASTLIGCSRKTITRYVNKGTLKTKKVGKKLFVNKLDVMDIAKQVHLNRDIHRPDAKNRPKNVKESLLSKKDDLTQLMEAAHANDEDLLNSFGKDIMMEVTEYLEGTGLLTTANKLTIFRYAMACQVQAMYMKTAIETHLKDFHDLANIYTKQIQHYEKELGLTPAALAKIKPMEKEVDEVDPMEALLNG